MKRWAPRLALRKRLKVIRKWPIAHCTGFIYTKIKNYSRLIMEFMVDIILLVEGKVSISVGNLFQATIELR